MGEGELLSRSSPSPKPSPLQELSQRKTQETSHSVGGLLRFCKSLTQREAFAERLVLFCVKCLDVEQLGRAVEINELDLKLGDNGIRFCAGLCH